MSGRVVCIETHDEARFREVLAAGDVPCVHDGAYTAYDSATVRASGSATVRAYDSATVTASGSATVTAYDSATVTASGSATVTASGSATVTAYDSATVTASGSATVTAYDSATVRAYDSATVTASGSATVTASGSATVTAYDSATVRAYGSATVTASGSATVTATGYVAVHKQSTRARVDGGVVIVPPDLSKPACWAEYYGLELTQDGKAVVVFKAVDDDLTSEYGTGYPVGGTVEAADWQPTRECGNGLHFSPRPDMALAYASRATRFLACEVQLRGLVPLGDKVKARRCRVLYEVDESGARIAPAEAAS